MFQIPLEARFSEERLFENFIVGDNGHLIERLLSCCNQVQMQAKFTFVWGAPGVGKSHLLQSVCLEASRQGERSAFISLQEVRDLKPDVLDNLADFSVVCIDDFDLVCGLPSWEVAIFNLYNQMLESKNNLLISSKKSPVQLDLDLCDLKSRLLADGVFQVKPLCDEKKQMLLIKQFANRGIRLSSEVGKYMLERLPRDVPGLLNTIQQLDFQSLSSQRRITIPFVKKFLQGTDSLR